MRLAACDAAAADLAHDLPCLVSHRLALAWCGLFVRGTALEVRPGSAQPCQQSDERPDLVAGPAQFAEEFGMSL
jgi:hypothetical protein